MKLIVVLFLSICTMTVVAQKKTYDTFTRDADSLLQAKNFKQAATSFSEAFKANNWKGRIDHRYSAARAWSMAGVADSAFHNLFRIANSGQYVNYERLISEPDLMSLHKDKRWTPLIEMIDSIQSKAEPKLDRKLANQLDSIYINDQKYRLKLEATKKRFGSNSIEVQRLWDIIKANDSINLVVVTRIIDERGWLGKDVIGERGNNTLFLVIQHSNLPTMLKYLPIIKVAVEKGDAKASSLALMEDRVNVFQNKKQIYGSQIQVDKNTGKYTLSPLDDPDNVDERRAKVGLGPIAKYISQWDIIWNPDDYK